MDGSTRGRDNCDDGLVRWLVTLEGNRLDIERLLQQPSKQLTATEEPRNLVFEVIDDDHDMATDDAREAGKALIEAAVRHLNGFARLRFGFCLGFPPLCSS